VESTQWVYSVGLVVVSARTIKAIIIKDTPHASMLPPKKKTFTPWKCFFFCFLVIPLLLTYPNVSRLSRTDGTVSHVNDLVSFDPQPTSSEIQRQLEQVD